MAAVAALTAVFVNLGFNQDAARVLTDVNKENITIDTLKDFDDAGVKTLCSSLRKPGGVIVQPVRGAGRGDGGVVPNRGVYVSALAERNMEAACYMAVHYARTMRTLTAQDITLVNVRRYAQYKQAEDAFNERDEVLKLEKPEKVIEFIDDWPEYLALVNGQNGCPLSYVIRADVNIPNEANDPPFGEPGSVYASIRDEMVARAGHNSTNFRVDNAKVYELLNQAVSGHAHVKTWIKSYAATRDGRGAWFAFKAHYRGSSEMEAIETAAEKKLDTLIYRGEKHRYNFETHVSNHMKAHIELEKATGMPMPEKTKVRRLLKSLQAPTMSVPSATIQATESLKSSFDASVNYLRAFISSTEVADTRNVSDIGTKKKNKKGGNGQKKGGGNKKSKGGGNKSDNQPQDRYYKRDEWLKLSQEDRDKIIQMRKKRKVSATKTPDDDDDSDTDRITQSQKKKKKQKKSVKDDKGDNDD
jgi:hypothetical protein